MLKYWSEERGAVLGPRAKGVKRLCWPSKDS